MCAIGLQKFKFYWLLLALIALFSLESFAQNQIKGTVTDSDTGEPLVGVNLIVKGTQIGTITDISGNFSVDAPSDGILVLSFIGFKTQEVPINGRSIIDVAMEFDISKLEEVIVIGYASRNKADVTSAVSSADMENTVKRNTADVTEALQGNVTGLQVWSTDKSPGSALNVNIRGISSPLGSAATPPLVIVDGIQISGLQYVDWENVVGEGADIRQSTGLENINPYDVESIEVLKDAAAAAIYGSRAANGVILVTTKRGRAGAPSVTYNLNIGTQVPFKGPDVANPEQYIQIMQGMYGEDLAEAELVPQAALDYLEDPSRFSAYDWYDIVYNNAFTQTHDLAVSGGGNFGNYRISTGYKDMNGIALGTKYQRFNIRATSDFNVSKKVRIGQTLSFSRSKTNPEPYAFSRSVYYKAIAQVPYFSPYGINPDPANDPSAPPRNRSFYWGGGENPEALIRNPLDYKEFWSRDIIQDNIQANLYLEYNIVKGLQYKINGSYNQADIFLKTRTRSMSQPQEYFNCERCIEESQVRESNWSLDNLLSYNANFGKHAISALVGYVVQEFSNRYLQGFKSDFLSDLTSTLDGPGANPLYTDLSGGNSKSRLNSIVSQLFYAFNDKYQVTFDFRRDGSSSFDETVRWGNFPGVSLGWRISNEKFWSGLGIDRVMSDFKLRAGYGRLGRQNSGTYPPRATLSYIPYSFDGNLADGLITGGPINAYITWEESTTANIGMEFGFLENQISGSFEYFERETDNLITELVIPGSAGGGEIMTNDGLIKNSGYEFSLFYSKSSGEFNFNIGANATYVDTELTEIPEDVIYGEAPEWDVPHVIEIYEGRAPSEFWLIKTDGIFKSQEEIDAHIGPEGDPIQPEAQVGDIKFIDFDGDGVITTEGDRQYIGRGRAPWDVGLNINMFYKSFDFTMNFYGNFGHYVFNGPKYLIEQPYGYDNFSAKLLDAFDPVTNPDSDFPRNNPYDIDENWNSNPATDRYLEKGNFIKVPIIELGYTIPITVTNKAGISNLRVSFIMQNLFTITGYDGIDPQQGRDGWLSAGIDRGTAPQSRDFLFNLSVTF